MKTKIATLLTLLSVGALLLAGPTPKHKSQIAEFQLKATKAIQKQVIVPITPPNALRSQFTRALFAPSMWHESRFTKIEGAPINHLGFSVVERHFPIAVAPTRNGNTKASSRKHPRDRTVVLTGYFDTASGAVYLLDENLKKHVKAALHPRIRATKTKAT